MKSFKLAILVLFISITANAAIDLGVMNCDTAESSLSPSDAHQARSSF